MKRIPHTQAIKWIHRRLDGMLKESQRPILDEHLGSCDSCRAYSDEMELLSIRLNHEFRIRWDKTEGPSQNMIEQVTTHAKKIPMTNRFSSGMRLVVSAIALIALA